MIAPSLVMVLTGTSPLKTCSAPETNTQMPPLGPPCVTTVSPAGISTRGRCIDKLSMSDTQKSYLWSMASWNNQRRPVHTMFICSSDRDVQERALERPRRARVPYACAREASAWRCTGAGGRDDALARPGCRCRRRHRVVLCRLLSGRPRGRCGVGQHGHLPLRGTHRLHHRPHHRPLGAGPEPRQSWERIAPLDPSAGGGLP